MPVGKRDGSILSTKYEEAVYIFVCKAFDIVVRYLILFVFILEAAVVKAESFTNRLIKEKSPYLLQHAHNPVDWYPWADEAFAKAKRRISPYSSLLATLPVIGVM